MACRSRGMTCVDNRSRAKPHGLRNMFLPQHLRPGQYGQMCRPAPEIAQWAISAHELRPTGHDSAPKFSVALPISNKLQAALKCVRASDATVSCVQMHVSFSAASKKRPKSARSRSAERVNCTLEKQVSRTSRKTFIALMNKARIRATISAQMRQERPITSCFVSRSISSMRATSNSTATTLLPDGSRSAFRNNTSRASAHRHAPRFQTKIREFCFYPVAKIEKTISGAE